MTVTPGGNPACGRCGLWYGPGEEHACPWSDPDKPGRRDADGVEWWACDPYPTWYRYDEDGKLRAKWPTWPNPDPEFVYPRDASWHNSPNTRAAKALHRLDEPSGFAACDTKRVMLATELPVPFKTVGQASLCRRCFRRRK